MSPHQPIYNSFKEKKIHSMSYKICGSSATFSGVSYLDFMTKFFLHLEKNTGSLLWRILCTVLIQWSYQARVDIQVSPPDFQWTSFDSTTFNITVANSLVLSRWSEALLRKWQYSCSGNEMPKDKLWKNTQ